VYINTPYLIIGDAIIAALCAAAKSGVDIRITTPHRPDKRYAHAVTRSYYRQLIQAGVRVYEYTDGFLHAKSFVSDGQIAVVGTANLDYRSLYLHFECGVCLYGASVITDIYRDFLETQKRCVRITEADCRSGLLIGFVQDTLRLLAPLM
jgi:cardiolipin synthase